MNPPFNDAARQNVSPDPRRRLAHVALRGHAGAMDRPRRVAARAAGTLTLIWRADGLADVLAALGMGFGGVAVLPVHPRRMPPAIRVLVRARKGSRAPLALAAGPDAQRCGRQADARGRSDAARRRDACRWPAIRPVSLVAIWLRCPAARAEMRQHAIDVISR